VTWAVFLFTVYPGFTQQWISVIYGQAFVLWAAQFFSIAITLWLARRRPSRLLLIAGTSLALALSAFTMFSTEYFFGLELFRPALLWLVLADSFPISSNEKWKSIRRRGLKVAAWWAPYLVLMLVFVIWRSYFHVFAGYQMTALEDLEQSPLPALQYLGLRILKDLLLATLVAWGQPLQVGPLFEATDFVWLRQFAFILAVGLLAAVYLARLRPDSSRYRRNADQGEDPVPPEEANPGDRGQQDRWWLQAVLVGLFAVLAAGWPFWITQLPLRMDFPQDRFSLPLSVGVSLLLAGLVDLAGRTVARKAMIVSLAVALAVGFHFTTAAAYRDDWGMARDFLWQLAWRAPSVQPRTIFLSTNLPFKYYEDDSLTAPINWTFDPDGTTTRMDYIFYDLLVRYHSLPALNPLNPVDKNFRGMLFSGNTSRILFVYYAPPGCVRILDPIYDSELYAIPKQLITKTSISNPRGLIQDHNPAAAPPVDIFGSEPKHRWCYFFEKADLARQNEDWPTIAELSEQSIREGYRPEDPAEYLPFIEAYTRIGRWADGFQLTQSAYRENPALRPALCAAWRRSASKGTQNGVDSSNGLVEQANAYLHCPSP